MEDLNTYRTLCDMIDRLDKVNNELTNDVGNIRKLVKDIDNMKENLLLGTISISEEEINDLHLAVDKAISGENVNITTKVETSATIEMFQLGASSDNVSLKIKENTLEPPEHGTIIQKLWKVGFVDNSKGHVIISDTSYEPLSRLVNAQLSTALSTAPSDSVENLGVTIKLSELEELINNGSQDISSFFNGFHKPGLVCRQLRDINIDTDPSLTQISEEMKSSLKMAIEEVNKSTEETISRSTRYIIIYSTNCRIMVYISWSNTRHKLF